MVVVVPAFASATLDAPEGWKMTGFCAGKLAPDPPPPQAARFKALASTQNAKRSRGIISSDQVHPWRVTYLRMRANHLVSSNNIFDEAWPAAKRAIWPIVLELDYGRPSRGTRLRDGHGTGVAGAERSVRTIAKHVACPCPGV